METLVNVDHGATTLLAGLVILLALHFIKKVAEWTFDNFKKKQELTDRHIEHLISAISLNTEALHRVEHRLSELEKELSSVSRLRLEVSRIFAAVKILGGDRWGTIWESIVKKDAEP